MPCPQCQILYINGLRCHETGCPLSHEGTTRECVECGRRFTPDQGFQHWCDDQCWRAYQGLPCPDDWHGYADAM